VQSNILLTLFGSSSTCQYVIFIFRKDDMRDFMTRELTAATGGGDQYKHVGFSLWDRDQEKILRPTEVGELGIVLLPDGRLMQYTPSLHWEVGQRGPTPVLVSQDVGQRYGLLVRCGGG
jgi:hypothetical protein